MTTDTAKDRIIAAATELFFKQGFLGTTVFDLVDKSGVSESTLRRHFKGKVAIYVAVLEVAAHFIHEKLLKEICQTNLNIETSVPKELVLLYVRIVLNLWQSEGEPKWHIGILFGYDGTATEMEDAKDLIKEGAMEDIKILDQIILRGCNNNYTKARNTSCIILGTLMEFVHSEIDSSVGYNRQYKVDGIIELLDIFLSTVFHNEKILFDELKDQGVSTESLKSLNNELKMCVGAIDRVLNK